MRVSRQSSSSTFTSMVQNYNRHRTSDSVDVKQSAHVKWNKTRKQAVVSTCRPTPATVAGSTEIRSTRPATVRPRGFRNHVTLIFWPLGHAERLLLSIHVPSLVLIAQAVFLLERGQRDRQTDATEHPIHAGVGNRVIPRKVPFPTEKFFC